MATNADIIKSLYEAFALGDVPAVLAAFDPQIEWNEADGVATRTGTRADTDTGQWAKALGA